jgi:thiol:disulfide interchange protein
MKNMLARSFVAVSLLAVMGQGCLMPAPAPSVDVVPDAIEKSDKAMMPKEDAMKKDESMMKPSASTYQPYTKAAYEAAKASGKPIFLFFYANWCPTCREQEPRLQRVVPTHKGGVVGLRVNYNDTETDEDEKALAKEFGVTYQHTGFFIDASGSVQKKTIGTFSDTQTVEYLDLIK